MRFAAVGLCFSLLLACNRSEESHSVDDAHMASAPVTAPPGAEKSTANAKPNPAPSVAGESSSATKCVVPLAEEPARRAPNALHCPADPDHPAELAHGYVVFADAPGSPRLNVELARSEPEKERGLMYRTKMPDDQGMLFSWNNEEPRRFWMHNTCIPLDMMFIARDGTISGILEQVPTLNDEARGVPCPDAYVLEVNAGWSRAHGIKPGSSVHFE
ncbi:MAG TPA: DUF192 domain-containing protein [Polyangiaceae bacterium]|jgi:hypothetical protein